MASAESDPASPPALRVLSPSTRRVRVGDLWRTRGVAVRIGVRDMKAKYKQAALGPLWLVLAPLGLLAAVTIAFSGVTDVDTSGIPYLLFALAGLTVWTFIQLSLTVGTQAIFANTQLVRRSPLPRLALLTGTLLGNLPPFLVMLTLTLAGTLVAHDLPVQALLLPVMLLWLLCLTLGTMLLFSAISVRYRDTVSIMPLIIQGGIFVTPVGYGLAGAPQNIHTLLLLNPVTGLIEAWRWSLLGLPNPSLVAMGISLGFTLAILVGGWRVFVRQEPEFADYV